MSHLQLCRLNRVTQVSTNAIKDCAIGLLLKRAESISSCGGIVSKESDLVIWTLELHRGLSMMLKISSLRSIRPQHLNVPVLYCTKCIHHYPQLILVGPLVCSPETCHIVCIKANQKAPPYQFLQQHFPLIHFILKISNLGLQMFVFKGLKCCLAIESQHHVVQMALSQDLSLHFCVILFHKC